MKPWKTIKSKYLFNDRWLTVRADTCETSDGVKVDPYYVLEYPDWAHIVALDPMNRVLITKQYRHAAGRICTEIPCGVIETGESPLNAARRELREETGCTAEVFEEIGHMSPNPGTHTNIIHCFLARNAAITEKPDPDDSEEIECSFIPVNEVFRMIDDGDFSQALHVACLLLGLRKAGLLKETPE